MVTIIVLLILAGITINLVIEQNGIVGKAKEAKVAQEIAEEREQIQLKILDIETEAMQTGKTLTIEEIRTDLIGSGLVTEVDIITGEITTAKGHKITDLLDRYLKSSEEGEGETEADIDEINIPKIVEGMRAVKWNGSRWEDAVAEDKSWYDYENKKWANSMTQDGSMWVWIPRFAYKLDSTKKKSEVKFLIGTSNKWYNKETKQLEELPTGYLVAPCFQDGSGSGFKNGEWDKELTGIWVAKFTAGYASGGNSAPVKASSTNYTQTIGNVPSIENGGKGDASLPARNWLDGEYGTKPTAIKYPTFQGNTYIMNYISISDSYSISKALTEEGNIYGLSSVSCDSHLIKNSEWGAIVYLSCSQYGRNGEEITINDTNLNNSVKSVYAVTGGNDYKTKVNQSSTNNIYGIYDMNGGVWERTAGYVANGDENLKKYGKSLAYDGDTLKTASTKYTTIYPHDSNIDKNGTTKTMDECSSANYQKNTKIYGDAVRETSTAGTGSTSWYGDYSSFLGLSRPLFIRGGRWTNGNSAGAFAFGRTVGDSNYDHGYRVSIVPQ